MSDIKPSHIVGGVVPTSAKPRPQPKKPKKSKALVCLIILLVVIIVALGLYMTSLKTNWDVLGLQRRLVSPQGQSVETQADWQAVFLTNGQVYFGKLSRLNDDYPVLEDIYYLQVQNVPIQPAQPATNEEGVQPAQQTQQRLILVKFGTELHRPMDKMFLNKDHILFFEDLSNDSNVVKAIVNYKAGGQQ